MGIAAFWKDNSGAVAVDWLVLTALLVAIGGLTAGGASTAMEDAARDLAGQSRMVAVADLHPGVGGQDGSQPDPYLAVQ